MVSRLIVGGERVRTTVDNSWSGCRDSAGRVAREAWYGQKKVSTSHAAPCVGEQVWQTFRDGCARGGKLRNSRSIGSQTTWDTSGELCYCDGVALDT